MNTLENIISNIDPQKILSHFLYNPKEPLVFNSGFFLFLFFLFFLFHSMFYRSQKARIIYIALFSMYFYYKSSGIYFMLLVVTSVIDFYAAKIIYDTESRAKKNFFLVFSLVSNLALLGYFKYTNFFIDSVNYFGGTGFQHYDIFLPAGISFYTFQSLSYTIDVYRKEFRPLESYLNFLFCVSFFPHLVAGPIIRASVIIPQIENEFYVSRSDFGRAVFLIATGLFKKVIIADYLSMNFVDRIFDEPLRYSGIENLIAAYSYSLQIYCDFSGYSDMAIGIALLIGFRIPDNFNAPYQSATITEFWRRWHISLSSWLRDYLYIPLGGNRKGKFRQYFNLFMTMFLGGLWHGANWKFVAWGCTHGLVLAVEKALNIPKIVAKHWTLRLFGIIVTFNIVTFCWIFFRAESFEKGYEMIERIFYSFNGSIFTQIITGYAGVMAILFTGYLLHFMPGKADRFLQRAITSVGLAGQAVLLVIVIFFIVQFKSSALQPFIYFQF